ncbi:1-deoxy-D-xylulose-5-phosphate synthase [Caproiciproducens faecalis]|uniref:1-deoxy-D-xylulose-5-phosphate synthase n=1 Tax=Caproiciproducens faecalis TaxID=2820301 RepID=A0ABS7DR17_9FIRM|nr:1-deoxy-D-xylulose-5-phosphate synthase [Caproiciproducens faecalis]MBW7573748.1 1-deoxy-D-xylulose-5-phosphate synthase [Caproiciproducens faecalis]
MDNLLNTINSPEDLQKLSLDELYELCDEIREKIIKTVSNNGGHLASNLGVVELTVALHRVFSSKDDKIVWDVGHQAYTHKILTGRRDSIATIRTKDGLSGYPNRMESEYDAFNVGHSSTSISAAFGIANAKLLSGEPGHVISLIGDGALTGGLAYEGLNNAGRFKKNFIVILNDNKMSISRNVGSMARYLAHIRTKPGYFKAKGNIESALNRLPHVGKPLHHFLSKSKAALKQILYNSTIFEDMGFYYYGPFDGHDLGKLIDVLENAKNINHPVLLHVLTCKGKGYPFAEQNPGAFHGISSFDIKTGKTAPAGENFSSVFGNNLCALANKDERICAITAAMQMGTGLVGFAKQFPGRFFDVGIAEEHAVTFAGGLAAGGMLPVCAIYSTFLQRGYDQIIHDAAIQRVKVTFAIDRAGVVGDDGETHQGIFDAAFLNTVPNITVYSPAFYDELYTSFQKALYECEGVSAVRYPRGKPMFKPFDFVSTGKAYDTYGQNGADLVIVTYGRLFSFACKALSSLRESGISVRIIKLNRITPVDTDVVAEAAAAGNIFFFEEGIQQGGIGEHFSFLLAQSGYRGEFRLRAITNFVPHATMLQSLSSLGLDDKGMVNMILTEYKK